MNGLMTRSSSLSVTALSVAVLIGAAGCTRTSDGSLVMRNPVAFSRLMNFGRRDRGADYAGQANEPRVFPAAASRPGITRPAARQVRLTGLSMSIVSNPPFKRPASARPLSCRNETSPAGRIRVVCG